MDKIMEYITKNNKNKIYALFNINNENINKTNEEISDTLLFNFPNENNIEIITNTFWIGEYKYYYFGIYKNKAISFSEDGLFEPFCNSIEEIPFEILRRDSQSFDYEYYNGKLSEENVLENISSFKEKVFEFLDDYLIFLNSNNILINKCYFKNNTYRFFYEYFKINYKYEDFSIKELEGKEFINISN